DFHQQVVPQIAAIVEQHRAGERIAVRGHTRKFRHRRRMCSIDAIRKPCAEPSEVAFDPWLLRVADEFLQQEFEGDLASRSRHALHEATQGAAYETGKRIV